MPLSLISAAGAGFANSFVLPILSCSSSLIVTDHSIRLEHTLLVGTKSRSAESPSKGNDEFTIISTQSCFPGCLARSTAVSPT
jgi:hypothetical protein